MTEKIGLISDVHASPAPTQEALTIFQREGVETILCAGDIAGYKHDLEPTIELLAGSGCCSVMGNHDLWWLEQCDDKKNPQIAAYLRALPRVVEFSAAEKTIHMVHASPPGSVMDGIKLFDEHATLLEDQKLYWTDYLSDFPADVLVVGHTHQVFAQLLGEVLVINPGSTLFNHTCAVLTLPGMEVEFFPLSGEKPLLVWNWGMYYAN